MLYKEHLNQIIHMKLSIFIKFRYNMGLTAFWSGIIATFGVANIILVFGIWV